MNEQWQLQATLQWEQYKAQLFDFIWIKKYTYLNHNSTVKHFITQTQNPKFKAAVYLAKYKKTQLIKIDITLGYENLRCFKMLIFNFNGLC